MYVNKHDPLDLTRWECPICNKGFIFGRDDIWPKHLLKHEKVELTKALLETEDQLETERLERLDE